MTRSDTKTEPLARMWCSRCTRWVTPATRAGDEVTLYYCPEHLEAATGMMSLRRRPRPCKHCGHDISVHYIVPDAFVCVPAAMEGRCALCDCEGYEG